jgi:2-dehydropantoate 2-reductase
MKIVIVGGGAMGSIFGARLSRAGHDTVIVDTAQGLVDKINADGITMIRDGETLVTPMTATSDPSSLGPVELVIFCVKSYHTEAAAHLVREVVSADTVVASLQNGLGNGDVLAATFGAERVTVGVTYNSGIVRAPAEVDHPADKATVVGSLTDDDTDGPHRLAQALNDAGLETTVASPVAPDVWRKLIHNAALLPTSALTGMTVGVLGACTDTHNLATNTANEAIAVAQALGHPIDREERISSIETVLASGSASKASMLQDFEAGRRTEIDVINGAVVRTADEVGIDVPINRTLVQLVKGWESARGLV